MKLYRSLDGGVQVQPSDFEYQNRALVDAISKLTSMYGMNEMLVISGLEKSNGSCSDGVVLYSGTVNGRSHKNVPVFIKGTGMSVITSPKIVVIVEEIISDKRVYNAAGVRCQAPYSELIGRVVGASNSDPRLDVTDIKRVKGYYLDLLKGEFIAEKDRGDLISTIKFSSEINSLNLAIAKKQSKITSECITPDLSNNFGVASNENFRPISFCIWGDMVQIVGAFKLNGGDDVEVGTCLFKTNISSPLPISDVYIPVNYYSGNKLLHVYTFALTTAGELKCVWENDDVLYEIGNPRDNIILTPTTFIRL